MLQAAGGQIAKRHRAAQRPHGRQSVKKLMAHGENVNSIEVEAPKLFDRMARRFNVDYAFYKIQPHPYPGATETGGGAACGGKAPGERTSKGGGP